MHDQGASGTSLSRGLALLGLLPLLVTAWLRPDVLPWLAWGAGLWALALLAKLFLLGPLYALAEPRLPGEAARAAAWGLASASAELGLSLAFLMRFPRSQALEISLWLGLGTGLIEIAYVMLMLGLQTRWPTVFAQPPDTGTGQLIEIRPEPRKPAETPQPSADRVEGAESAEYGEYGEYGGAAHVGPTADAFVRWSGLLERVYTILGHVCSRGLLGLGLAADWLWLPALAWLAFTGVDGFASYAQARGWNFADPATARRFHGILAAVGLAEALALYLLWRCAS